MALTKSVKKRVVVKKTRKQNILKARKPKHISRHIKTLKTRRKQRAGSIMNTIEKLISGDTGISLCAPVIVKPSTIKEGNQVAGRVRDKHIKEVSRHNTNTKVVEKKSVHPESCLTEPVVLKLVKAWNIYARKKSNANYPIIREPSKKPPAKLWEVLQERLGKGPEDHWFNHQVVKDTLTEDEIEDIKNEHYRPEAPKEWHNRQDAWLSTTDIEDLLKQYEAKYPEFKSYGASPIDFDLKGRDIGRKPGQPGAERCMVNPLCNISLRELTKDRQIPIKYIGVVFNLDPHDKAGSHWVSLFVNLPRQEINYWDSYGYQPPKEVIKLMKKLHKQAKQIGLKNIKCQVNKYRHQYKNSECGMYSSWFIIEQLEGRSFDDVCQHIIRDDDMNQKRRVFYNY